MYIKSNETKNISFIQGDEDVGYAVAFSNVHPNKKSQYFSVPLHNCWSYFVKLDECLAYCQYQFHKRLYQMYKLIDLYERPLKYNK
jgi:hypothetical protein